MIPEQNMKDLALNGEIVEAVRNGKFHIYQINNVDEGIELLTGVQAGNLDSSGKYPPQSVHGMVMAKLQSYHDAFAAENGDVKHHTGVTQSNEEF